MSHYQNVGKSGSPVALFVAEILCALDAVLFDGRTNQRTNQRTNKPTDKAFLGVGYILQKTANKKLTKYKSTRSQKVLPLGGLSQIQNKIVNTKYKIQNVRIESTGSQEILSLERLPLPKVHAHCRETEGDGSTGFDDHYDNDDNCDNDNDDYDDYDDDDDHYNDEICDDHDNDDTADLAKAAIQRGLWQ